MSISDDEIETMERPMGGPELVVSRHQGLIDFLQEEGILDEEVERIEHASADDVEGRHVIGNLPSRLAAQASLLTEVDLDYPEGYRGEGLDADEGREYATGLATYQVEQIG